MCLPSRSGWGTISLTNFLISISVFSTHQGPCWKQRDFFLPMCVCVRAYIYSVCIHTHTCTCVVTRNLARSASSCAGAHVCVCLCVWVSFEYMRQYIKYYWFPCFWWQFIPRISATAPPRTPVGRPPPGAGPGRAATGPPKRAGTRGNLRLSQKWRAGS